MADDLAKAEQEVEALRKSLLEAREKLKDNTLKGFGGDVPPLGNINIKLRRTLKGHLHKIYAMQWAKDKPHLASASQDGKVIVWNAITCLKQHALPLKNTWVMTCAFSPAGDFVASGGLDNICTVHNLKASDPNKPFRELQGHNGFLSGCRFLSEKEIITASGDYTAALWDIEQGEKKLDFIGHQKDVTFVALSNDGSQIATSSVDRSARIWDVKTGKCVRYFQGPPLPPPQPNQEITGDANCVEFFPGGEAISVAYEDGVIRLFDSRSYAELNVYNPPDNHGSAVSLAFTTSGRYMFASYAEQPKCVAWDFIKAETKGALSHHDKRISSIGIGGGGSALCTASWDQTLKIWA